MNRRRFLKNMAAAAPALSLAYSLPCTADAAAAVLGSEPRYTLPSHLPKKLSIGMFLWNWITMATPEEPYHDLEKTVAGLRERGFNAVRVEAGLNWCFHMDGRPRGEMEFGPWIPGYRDNLTSANAKGGGRLDVLQRVVHLMELARKYDVYVILTSWEYQDSSWLVADPRIRAEVMGVPEPQRFMHLARQHDRLLRILQERQLQKHIAFVEVHNEPDASRFPQGSAGKKLHEEAIGFLHDRHDDILISGDYTTHNPSLVPDNIQVYDQHTYTGLYRSLYSQTVESKDFDPADPKKNALLRRLLKDSFVPYSDFVKAAENVGTEAWRPRDWLYYNLNIEAFDEWIVEQYKLEKTGLEAAAIGYFEADAKEAARRNIPAVCDEGGYFYPPLKSKFEVTLPGTSMFQLQVDLAIQHGYWGMMPTTYCGAEHPIWQDITWLRAINDRFQASRTSTS